MARGSIIWEEGNYRVGQHPHLQVFHVLKLEDGDWVTLKEFIGVRAIDKVKGYLTEKFEEDKLKCEAICNEK